MTTTGWLVAYDVSDDRSRRRVAGILGARGLRVEYSVFALEAGHRDLARVMIDADAVMGCGDLLLALARCPSCWAWERGRPIEDPLGIGLIV
ncbi:MAG: CRISPR-associated endonuclease Cas2 [Acidimicrobiales bacterium]